MMYDEVSQCNKVTDKVEVSDIYTTKHIIYSCFSIFLPKTKPENWWETEMGDDMQE